MRIAITGHRDLYGSTAAAVENAVRDLLPTLVNEVPLVGITCLADGADTIFAEAILTANGTIEVVIPATEYRDGLPDDHHPTYDRLLSKATAVTELDYRESSSESHMAASLAMIDSAELLVAVWDGQPARGPGGTADVVDAAQERDMPVMVVWPKGAQRG